MIVANLKSNYTAAIYGRVPTGNIILPVPELWAVEIFVAATHTRLTSARI
jgi:hypothetical protein